MPGCFSVPIIGTRRGLTVDCRGVHKPTASRRPCAVLCSCSKRNLLSWLPCRLTAIDPHGFAARASDHGPVIKSRSTAEPGPRDRLRLVGGIGVSVAAPARLPLACRGGTAKVFVNTHQQGRGRRLLSHHRLQFYYIRSWRDGCLAPKNKGSRSPDRVWRLSRMMEKPNAV